MRNKKITRIKRSLMFLFWTILVIYLDANTLGDANSDNRVTIIDALMTAQYAVGLNPSPFTAGAADMNWDGKVDIVDALIVAQYYVFAMKDFTIFAMSQCNPLEEDPQVYDLKPDLNFRAIMKWDTMGDEVSDYNFSTIKRYHDNNISFIGGGTTTIIFEHDFSSHDIFMDMATRDANNQLVRHDEVLTGVDGLYRASIANPKYRKYVTDWAKIQIDGGVDGLCFDEVIAGFSGGIINNWNGNEGFDDYFITDFNKYLIEKYPDYTQADWKNNYGMTDDNIIQKNINPADLVNNFNYRKYLQDHGWNGTTTTTGPLVSQNPLAKEWGVAVNNRMYRADTFLGLYTPRYWQEIVYELKRYAKEKYNKYIYITSNGILPFVDFNCLGMYPWNPDEQTPDYRGADYVPVAGGHLNGSKSLMPIYKTIGNKNHETAGDVPLVVFIDWPTEMLDNYNNLPLAEKKDYWQIFGAEAYACGLYPAFHLKDTLGTLTAAGAGILDFFKTYKLFYKNNKEIYNHLNYYYPDLQVLVNRSNIAQNLMSYTDGTKYALHLINHNYNNGIILQENFAVTVALNKIPQNVYMISPDFDGKKNLSYQYNNHQLIINVDKITYYDIVVIECTQDGITTHDLEYYKSKDNYTINYPFPQAGIIKNWGIRPAVHSQEEMNAHCRKAFEDWVKYWVTVDNCPAGSARLHMGPGPGIPYYAEPYGTISEFIGWGLLVCVLMDNAQHRTRNLFECLNNFRKAYTNEYGLMMSTINFNKPMDSYNKDSAAEADENMAMALLMAHYQWGNDGGTNYLTEAAGLLHSISTHLVERPAYVLKPAAAWGGSACLDPCYYDPMYYPLWYSQTGDSCWTKLGEHYKSLVAYFCNQYQTGLLPDWCKADGSSTGLADKAYIFSWDAHQISTKWAIHYAWFGTKKTDVFFNAAKKLAAWVKKEANGDLSSLVDSYSLDGKPIGTYSYLPAMVGATCLSGTVSAEYQDLVNNAYDYLLTLDSGANYNWGNSLGKVVQLLVYSGNFVNFTDLDS